VTINAAWRFHTGDDPQWASPSFDDSQWPLLRIDKTWAAQGYKGYYGFSWYRLKLKLPATSSPLASRLTEINSANEVYADGRIHRQRWQNAPRSGLARLFRRPTLIPAALGAQRKNH